MFSEQYKKENEKISLDDEFLEQLKAKMRQEQAKLQTSATKESSSDELVIDFNSKKVTPNWKRTLPIALSACAAIAIITILPRFLFQSKSNKETSSATSYSDDVCINESADYEASYESDEMCDDSYSSDTTSGMKGSSNLEVKNDQMSNKNASSGSEKLDGASPETMTFDNEDGTNSITDTENGAYNIETPSQDEITVVSTPNDITFAEADIDFNATEEFIPNDLDSLTETSKVFMTKQQGTEMVNLDYAMNGKVILHDYYGLVIYDYIDEEPLRIIDLPSRIGTYTTQGDSPLLVTVYQGGHYLVLDPDSSESDNGQCYLYDVQTDTMVSMTHQELASLELPVIEENLSYESSAIDSMLSPEYRSSSTSIMNNSEQGFLYYQSSDDPSVASLTFCIITFDQKGNRTSTQYVPIYGDYALTEVREEGYLLDRIIK